MPLLNFLSDVKNESYSNVVKIMTYLVTFLSLILNFVWDFAVAH